MSEQLKAWLFDGDCIHCSVCKTVLDIDSNDALIEFPLVCPECGTSMEGVINA